MEPAALPLRELPPSDSGGVSGIGRLWRTVHVHVKSKPNSNKSGRSTSEDCARTESRWTPILGISSLNPRAVSKRHVLFCASLYKFSEFLAYPSEAVELEARG